MKALCVGNFYFRGNLQKKGEVVELPEETFKTAEKKGVVEGIVEAKEVKTAKKEEAKKEVQKVEKQDVEKAPKDRQMKTGRKRRKK